MTLPITETSVPPDSGEERQRRLVAALSRPGSLAPEGAELMETHISRVLLAGEFAWKIKKPVNLGFLDFSSLVARHHFCREELRLNGRLAPDLYLEVVAIRGTPEAPVMAEDGAGDAFEYAVKMLRFPQQCLADRLLAAGDLRGEVMDQLAQAMAAFHGTIPRAGGGDGHGTPARILDAMRQNFALIRQGLNGAPATHLLDELEAWSEGQFAALSGLMDRRRESGFIRECHGDLHLGNIAVLPAGVRVFDGIEFNPELRWIDIQSEVAFLAMDCAGRNRPDLAWRFLDRWLVRTGDYAGLALWRWYAVYRALVRGMVALLRAAQLVGSDRQAAWQDGLAHLRLAHTLAHPRPATLILTHGLAGSGKTTIARALVEALPALSLRSDVERKRLAGLAPEARSGSPLDGGIYGEEITRATYEELARLARLVLAAGHSVVVDAGFLLRRQRDAFRALARDMGLPCVILDCQAEEEALRRRIISRWDEGKDASEASLAVLARQLASAEALGADEPALAVDSSKASGNEALWRALRGERSGAYS